MYDVKNIEFGRYHKWFCFCCMVRRASLAHHWIGASNHPERPSESEGVEGLPLKGVRNTTGLPVDGYGSPEGVIEDRTTKLNRDHGHARGDPVTIMAKTIKPIIKPTTKIIIGSKRVVINFILSSASC